MLTRIHVDNFRCLVNFDLKLDRLNLLLGENGSGKTTVFEVLRRLQGFLGGVLSVDEAFPARDLTRWQTLEIQNFELELKLGNDAYVYTLSIEHDRSRRNRRVKREGLLMNKRPLFEFERGTAQLYRDDFSAGPQYPFDWSRSGVASLQARPENTLLTNFRQQISRMIVVSPCPVTMTDESREDNKYLAPLGSNFPSWYRYLSLEHQGNIFDLTLQLRNVLPGFDSFILREAGEARLLKVYFHSKSYAKQTDANKPEDQRKGEMSPSGNSSLPSSPSLWVSGSSSTSSSASLAGDPYNSADNRIGYDFGQLSDGQRQLIFVYSLLYGIKGLGYSLFLDEPDNYVMIREIQPWLTALEDACGDSISQVVLISHHPEIIDYLSGSACRWFERPDNGPTRVKDESPAPVDGLKTSETIARGLNA